jgi:hypothetical protein
MTEKVRNRALELATSADCRLLEVSDDMRNIALDRRQFYRKIKNILGG